MSFSHDHTSETYDEYTTEKSAHRITAQYQDGGLVAVHLRLYNHDKSDHQDTVFYDLVDLDEILLALNAALAGIRKGEQNGRTD